MGKPKEKTETNGLVGAKNMGPGGPTLEKKKNGLVWAKTRRRGANLRTKEKTNGLVGAKNRGGEGQLKEKKENKWISRG